MLLRCGAGQEVSKGSTEGEESESEGKNVNTILAEGEQKMTNSLVQLTESTRLNKCWFLLFFFDRETQ